MINFSILSKRLQLKRKGLQKYMALHKEYGFEVKIRSLKSQYLMNVSF